MINIVFIPSDFAALMFFMLSSTMMHCLGTAPTLFSTNSNELESGLQCGRTSVTPNNLLGSKYFANPISFNTLSTYSRGPLEKPTICVLDFDKDSKVSILR
mmetsp:Transcript_26242/g.41197  ORF Transcript_26242/g.41197 Transcript_26242/m.41197 type:complete len:101 (-) Transcript_26242:401-703(-)